MEHNRQKSALPGFEKHTSVHTDEDKLPTLGFWLVWCVALLCSASLLLVSQIKMMSAF